MTPLTGQGDKKKGNMSTRVAKRKEKVETSKAKGKAAGKTTGTSRKPRTTVTRASNKSAGMAITKRAAVSRISL